MQTERILIAPNLVAEGFLIPVSRSGVAIAVGDRCTLGRDATCELVLADPFVSSRHARIERRQGNFMLRDLQSPQRNFLKRHAR